MDTHEKEVPLEQKLAQWADILRGQAVHGLHYAANIYEKERYQKILDVAQEMFACATGQTLEGIDPLKSVLFTRASPIPSADAAVIDDDGRILLIRRADNGLWAMPGGGIDIGETPAQAAVREALEETGVSSEPVALVGIHDSRFCGTVYPLQLYQMNILCRPLLDVPAVSPPTFAHEVLDIQWFPEHALPAEIDPGHRGRIPEAFRVWHGDRRAYVDLHA
ncbi:hypothetical protein KDH_06720 [Dictyobacter sp. S3.2.2.5]|uniref:Nudix hydrolase domain-containing protein n=1 Tax=Dictyobacter halimunensis TaxID=3026934 RepID=A0ABQ6FJR1_9CHLR|nr:hypothetical protein KDH_06720 [Dictyobacter sp. S3.2.2.5]